MDILPTKRSQVAKVPLIVVPHGGPQGVRDSWNYIAEDQLFASRGYATLHVILGFRFGKEFMRAVLNKLAVK
jgi:dipeptidyl aminopeptidase/acylaminoacyl peptidase